MPSDEIPEEVVKFASSLFIPAFAARCAERGYTHLDSEDMVKKALRIVERIKKEQAEQQETRNKLAKEASEKFAKDE